jgi:hypothetical protein
MLPLIAFALQQASVSVEIGSKSGAKVQVVAHEAADSTHGDSLRAKRKPIVATPAQLTSAFLDANARLLLLRAREARTSQDSSIQSYDASTLQRLTIGLAFTRFGRDRLFFRHESAAHVRWARGIGARIDVTGKRSVVPMLGGSSEVDIESILSPVPYYPGRDALWIGLSAVNPNATDDDVVHPLANSAEAYYAYRSGDSISFRLPDGTTIQLRELEVRPRKADWHAVVGSLWFDVRTGQLVRAAYRLSEPLDMLAGDSSDDPGFMARAILRPANANISGVAVEYGLYQGKYWMPRSQVGEGGVQVGLIRIPMRIEERFTYAGVNDLDTLPEMPPKRAPQPRDTTAQGQRHADSVAVAERHAECDATGQHSMRATRYNGALPVIVHIPCDTAVLAHSPALPASIYDPGEQVFGDAERDALLAKAAAMMPGLPLAFSPPRVEWGLNLLRYNRVEGLSTAVDITQSIGTGYAVRLSPRIGIADRIPNAELSASRITGAGVTALTAYRRLAAANDWGNPLDFGSGLSAFMFGRDEGLYYRTEGAELAGDHLFATQWQWRVFSEREGDAVTRTNVSVPQLLGSDGFRPIENIAAERIRETGASLRNLSSFGLDPNGFRLLSDVRVEGATGGRDYGRGALDLTLSHPLGRVLHRDFATAITAGAGTSAGTVPVQRLWYLGGTSTIRGEPAGSMAGDSYWLTHTELGYGSPGMRRIAFFDLGWAGDRTQWRDVGRPASGVGIGASLLDGLIRFDVARGLYPTAQWHSALYLEARF